MAVDWQPLVNLVARCRRFLLTTHMRPDGDGLGSMVALAAALRAKGKSVRLVIPSSFPSRYDFLDPQREIAEFSPDQAPSLAETDAMIVIDTGTWNQLGKVGDFMRGLTVPKVVIDHHPTQDDLGALRLVDTSAEAVGRLVHEAIAALDYPLTTLAAHALFAALAMDTGWFRHRNTTAATFRLAADLTAAGAQPDELHRLLFDRNRLGRVKLAGLVMQRLTVEPSDRIAHSYILRTDYPETGAVPADSEDLVNHTLSVEGVEVGLLFLEQPAGGTKVSLRSRGKLNVGKIAEHFGGGGHAAAAGMILATDLPTLRTEVLGQIRQAYITTGSFDVRRLFAEQGLRKE
jgi:phosphoesterase RecJ-like protein